MYYYLEKKTSHRKWRSFVKSERRRKKRREMAILRDQKAEKELSIMMSNSAYRAWLEEQELLEEEALRMEELNVQKRREEWMARDLALHKLWLQNKEKKMAIAAEQKSQEEKIKREWEERLRKEKEEKERKSEAQEVLLKEATRGLGQSEITSNPDPPPGHSRLYTEPVLQPCPFFLKTGACRFGIQCSREHSYPASSRTLLLPHMFSHFGFRAADCDDYDMDVSLEYTEVDLYDRFRDFYCDVLPEFEKLGPVVQLKVCCNRSAHLRGNVYVMYEREEDARTAFRAFNGRWYAGRQITCRFVPVLKWKPAICGLYWSQRCPKGDQCNFLHVYRNPGNAFYEADRDLLPAGGGGGGDTSRRSRRSRSRDCSRRRKNRSRDRSNSSSCRKSERSSSRRSRNTSRDRDGSAEYISSRSRDRSSRRKRSKDRDRRERKARSRSNDRESQKQRSRSKNTKSQSRKRTRSRSKDKTSSRRSENRSRSR